jgi:serine/threonine-protein kinase RsbT
VIASKLIKVAGDRDIAAASESGRKLAKQAGFEGADLVAIATAISELARDIVTQAGGGAVEVSTVDGDNRSGFEIIARDENPSSRLGLDLPDCERLMDELVIESALGQGTTVTLRKWVSS